jgi:hypothetical protein
MGLGRAAGAFLEAGAFRAAGVAVLRRCLPASLAAGFFAEAFRTGAAFLAAAFALGRRVAFALGLEAALLFFMVSSSGRLRTQ